MQGFDLWLTLLASLVLLLGLATGLLRSRGYLPTEPILAVAVGIAVGPAGIGLLNPLLWPDPYGVFEHVTRLTIAIAVMSIALRLPPDYYWARVRSLATVLGPGMVVMWLASALVVYLVLAVDPLVALLVGAVVTPTDPVLANSIVVGETAARNIPQRLRFLLSGESGINDGAAHPFVFLPILLLHRPLEAALTEWVVSTLLLEVLGAVIVGAAIGIAFGRLERWEHSRDYLEETSVLTITVALTFAVLGAVALLGGVDILAVFAAGVGYNWQADPADEAAEQRVEEVFNRLFTLPVFVLFGMLLPWGEWIALGWAGPLLVAGILLFRRLPMILAFGRFIAPLDRPAASVFVGWFGPIGIAALFYALVATAETGNETVWVVGSLIVAGSVLVHGMTATAATHWYGRIGDTGDGY